MQSKKGRSSNMELLRVLAMGMIVVFHIFLHNVVPQVSEISESYPYFGIPRFSPRIASLVLFQSLGATGNGIFILISGYFMAGRDPHTINLENTFKKILLQFGFATGLLCAVSMVCSRLITATYIPIITDEFFNTDLWFIGYYLLIILFAKLFFNDFLGKLDRGQYRTLLLVLFAAVELFWLRALIDNFNSSFNTLLTGLFQYAFAGYIRRYNPFGRVRLGAWILGLVSVYLCLFVSVYSMTQTALQQNLWSQKAFTHPLRRFGNSDLSIILLSTAWFELFRRIRLPHSKIINFLGKSTFMVYILHENKFSHALWDLTNWRPAFYDAPVSFYKALTKWTVLSFLFGAAAYGAFLGAGKLVHTFGWLLFKKEPDSEAP